MKPPPDMDVREIAAALAGGGLLFKLIERFGPQMLNSVLLWVNPEQGRLTQEAEDGARIKASVTTWEQVNAALAWQAGEMTKLREQVAAARNEAQAAYAEVEKVRRELVTVSEERDHWQERAESAETERDELKIKVEELEQRVAKLERHGEG